MKRRILLVDGEGQPLRELRGELAALASGWEIQLAASGTAALASLSATPADAVVADMLLADMTGEQLLSQVMPQFPHTHRVVLADLGDLEALLRCVGGVHQFVSKPCTAARLHVVLQRAFHLDLWLPNHTVRRLIGRVPRLPSTAEAYNAVARIIERDDATPERVGAAIARDPAMTAKMLQLANSAAYGDPTDDFDPVEAVREIGLTNTRSCLLLAHTWSSFSPLEQAGHQMASQWLHAREAAGLAAWLSESVGASATVAGMARTAGLLHDLGKLALAANLPEQFIRAVSLARERDVPAWQAEQEVFGATHGEVGGGLLGFWGLPMAVVEAVALHHHPTCLRDKSFSPLTAVHVADALLRAESGTHFEALVDRDYLAALGLAEKIPAWWSAGAEEIKRLRAADARPNA
jgi:HD-like signal output (HDOD) protein/CheY-like chemotaxis protein